MFIERMGKELCIGTRVASRTTRELVGSLVHYGQAAAHSRPSSLRLSLPVWTIARSEGRTPVAGFGERIRR